MGRANCITDKQVVQRVQVAVKLELEKNKALGVPIVVYDRERKIIIKNSIFRNSLIFQGLPPIKYQNLMYFPLFLPL